MTRVVNLLHAFVLETHVRNLLSEAVVSLDEVCIVLGHPKLEETGILVSPHGSYSGKGALFSGEDISVEALPLHFAAHSSFLPISNTCPCSFMPSGIE